MPSVTLGKRLFAECKTQQRGNVATTCASWHRFAECWASHMAKRGLLSVTIGIGDTWRQPMLPCTGFLSATTEAHDKAWPHGLLLTSCLFRVPPRRRTTKLGHVAWLFHPWAISSLYFAMSPILTLGNGIAMCSTKRTRQRWICHERISQVKFVGCYTRQRIC